MTTKPKWHKGAPPSIGWWPASVVKEIESIRWFDGNYWPTAAWTNCTGKEAAKIALVNAPNQEQIEWTDRWWL